MESNLLLLSRTVPSEFILETDHQPLQYLRQAKFQNGRLMRWALTLQPYRFLLRSIRGRDNIGADCLSRNLLDDEHLVASSMACLYPY